MYNHHIFTRLIVIMALAFSSCTNNESYKNYYGRILAALDLAYGGNKTAPPASPVRLVFIHHSVGGGWLSPSSGNLGTALNASNYYVSDTYYEWGPQLPDIYPQPTYYDSYIGSHTDTRDWPNWFNTSDATVMNAVYTTSNHHDYTNDAGITDPGGANEIIMFKSCFPNSEVGAEITDEQAIYNSLLHYFAAHPEKMFVFIVPPPQVSLSYPANTRALANWLVNEWLAAYNQSHNNVYVYDYYNVLTHPDNHHRVNNGAVEHVVANSQNVLYYPSWDSGCGCWDSHPTAEGQQKAAAEFVPVLNVFYNSWQGN